VRDTRYGVVKKKQESLLLRLLTFYDILPFCVFTQLIDRLYEQGAVLFFRTPEINYKAETVYVQKIQIVPSCSENEH
jgi:hypothetical protein